MEKIKVFLKSPLFPSLLVVFTAAFFRLYKIPSMMEFLGDQGRDVLIVRDLLHGNLVFIGPQTSIGNMYLGPFYYYLLAPALLLSFFSPLGPALLIAILGIFTSSLLFKISKQFFKFSIALLISLLYAVSPVVVKYSNFSWNPNIMPLLALLVFWSTWQIWQKKSWHHLPLLSFSLSAALQSHYLALLLFPFSGLFVLVSLYNSRRQKNFTKKLYPQIGLALLIFFLFLLPLILFDLRHQGQNIGAIKTFFTVRQTTVNLKAYKALPLIWPLFVQINTRLLAARAETLGLFLSLFLAFGSAAFFLKGLFLSPKKRLSTFFKKNPEFTIIITWIATAIVGLGLYKQHIYDHYFGFLFPAPFLLLGLLLDRLFRLKLTRHLFLLSLIIFSAFVSSRSFLFPVNQLQETETVAAFIQEKAAGEPFNLALLAKTNYDDAYQYFLAKNQAPFYNHHDLLANQLFVICEPHPDINCDPYNNPAWEIAAFGWAKPVGEWEILGRKIYQLVSYNEKNNEKN